MLVVEDDEGASLSIQELIRHEDVEISGLVLWRIWIKSSGVRGAIDTLSVLGQLEALPR